MSTPFQKALSEYVSDEREWHTDACSCRVAGIPPNEAHARALARAGDALESVLRQMMREEAPGIPHGGPGLPFVRFEVGACTHRHYSSGGPGKPDYCDDCGEEL